MRQAGVVPVGDIEAAVGAGHDINRPKPAVGRVEGVLEVFGAVGGALGNLVSCNHQPLQRIDSDQLPLIPLGHHHVVVDHQLLSKPPAISLERHVVEEAEGVGIRQRPMLAPVLHAIAALHIVHAAGLAPVGA